MWGYQSYHDHSKGTHRIVSYWGRIRPSLSKLQQKEKVIENFWDAQDYIKKKIDEKLRKGYVAVDSAIYSQYSTEEISLSEFIQAIQEAKLKSERKMSLTNFIKPRKKADSTEENRGHQS